MSEKDDFVHEGISLAVVMELAQVDLLFARIGSLLGEYPSLSIREQAELKLFWIKRREELAGFAALVEASITHAKERGKEMEGH